MGRTSIPTKPLTQTAHKRSSFSKLNASFSQNVKLLAFAGDSSGTNLVRPSNVCDVVTGSTSRLLSLHYDGQPNSDTPPLIPRRQSSNIDCVSSDVRRGSRRANSSSNKLQGSHNAVFPLLDDEPAAPPPKKVMSAFLELSSSMDKPPRQTLPGYKRKVDVAPTKPTNLRSESTNVLSSLARIRLQSSANLAAQFQAREQRGTRLT